MLEEVDFDEIYNLFAKTEIAYKKLKWREKLFHGNMHKKGFKEVKNSFKKNLRAEGVEEKDLKPLESFYEFLLQEIATTKNLILVLSRRHLEQIHYFLFCEIRDLIEKEECSMTNDKEAALELQKKRCSVRATNTTSSPTYVRLLLNVRAKGSR